MGMTCNESSSVELTLINNDRLRLSEAKNRLRLSEAKNL